MQENTESELRLWLAFSFCKGLGLRIIRQLGQRVPLPELVSLTQDALIKLGCCEALAAELANIDWRRVDACLADMEKAGICALGYSDTRYPSLLKEISSPPLVLFCRGDVDLLSAAQMAVVGSRGATPGGCEIAASLCHRMASDGLVITSGMAAGIDGASHKGALSADGATIAVLGCGVDIVYPKRHGVLAAQIAENGLLVSEFAPGVEPKAAHFPRRNRIIAGLSLGVLVVEAEMKSGSLITAKYALEQNREVFAVPGSVFNPLSQGCHYLIKEGAKLVETVKDIYDEVSFFPKNGLYSKEGGVSEDDSDPVLQHLGYEATSVEILMVRTGWPIEKLLAHLLDLELENKVEHVFAGYIRQGRR